MYIDLITQIKNSQILGKESIKVKHSKADERVLVILKKYGFVDDFEKKGKAPKRYLHIDLAYDEEGAGKILGTKFISKPSKRVYKKKGEIKKIRKGNGITVISTSKGVMEDKQAKENNVGGQVLFEIW